MSTAAASETDDARNVSVMMEVQKIRRSIDIKEFSKQTRVGRALQGEPFAGPANSRWYLLAYPAGDDQKHATWVSIFLIRDRSQGQVPVWLRFSVWKPVRRETFDITDYTFRCYDDRNTCFGQSQLITRLKVSELRNGFLQNDTLTLVCEMDFLIGAPNYDQPVSTIPLQKIVRHQQQVLATGNYSDCTLVCVDGEVSSYKALLAAQSSVFDAMFQSGLEEARTGRVEIADFNSDVMSELARFVRCGRVQNLGEYAEELLRVAVKYLIDDLQSLCAAHLSRSLNKENVCRLMIIAHLHQVEGLKKDAIGQFREYSANVQELAGFSDLLQHKELVAMIFQSLAPTVTAVPQQL